MKKENMRLNNNHDSINYMIVLIVVLLFECFVNLTM